MVTSLYSGILCFLYFYLSMETIKARRKHKISVGYGPNNEIASIASAHSNFSSYVVLILFMLFLVESSGAFSVVWIHILGSALTAGRLFHFVAFRNPIINFKFRVLGMHLTLWPLVILATMNLYLYLVTFL